VYSHPAPVYSRSKRVYNYPGLFPDDATPACSRSEALYSRPKRVKFWNSLKSLYFFDLFDLAVHFLLPASPRRAQITRPVICIAIWRNLRLLYSPVEIRVTLDAICGPFIFKRVSLGRFVILWYSNKSLSLFQN
jgi:hypothetical protein